MPLGNAFILSLTQVAPIGYINVFDFEPAIIAYTCKDKNIVVTTIAPGRYQLSHHIVISLISLVVAYGTEPGIAPCLFLWAFLTWG